MVKEPGMQTITKRDLIDRVAQATGHRRADVKRAITVFLEVMVDELAQGNRIEFREFGVFETRERAARTAQNPKTLQPVVVPPRRTVKFKAGRQVRDRMDMPPAPPLDAGLLKAPAPPPSRPSRTSTGRRNGRLTADAIRVEVKAAKSGATA
jgi:integration host factor subunit beta